MAIQTIRRPAVIRRTQDTTSDLDWSLNTVPHRDTVIAAFDSPYEASAAMTRALLLPGARVWQRSGSDLAAGLRHEWQNQSLLSRVLGVSDEERLVDQVTADLVMGRSIVVIHTPETKRALALLTSAARMIRMGRWTFEFIR